MSDHIEWMVKGCDRRDCADRFALRENLAAFAMGGQITGKNLSIILNCKLTCQRENIVRTTCFIKRMLFADAQFKCQPWAISSRRARISSAARNRICWRSYRVSFGS